MTKTGRTRLCAFKRVHAAGLRSHTALLRESARAVSRADRPSFVMGDLGDSDLGDGDLGDGVSMAPAYLLRLRVSELLERARALGVQVRDLSRSRARSLPFGLMPSLCRCVGAHPGRAAGLCGATQRADRADKGVGLHAAVNCVGWQRGPLGRRAGAGRHPGSGAWR